MFSGVYDAAGGMVIEMQRVNNITNNIANLNTPGFKKEGINVKSWSRIWGMANANLPIPPDTQAAANFINETKNSTPHLDTNYIDFSQGPLRHTGNKLDFALEGKGFFLVLAPKGIQYTRNGQFEINKDGILIQRGTGYPVVGENYLINHKLIKITGKTILIKNDGEVYSDGVRIDKLAIRDFANYTNLKKEPNSMFSPINGESPIPAPNTFLKEGYLEMSNVTIVNEMVKLIESQRNFERYQRVIDSLGNELLSDIARNLSKVG
ncbi:flagellar hook-basal body protein [Hippea maritima]|uniref:Flagellar hook-basal body protein n=1 Tax=Hippea maritima (strain ATCC 700847 / DSM 10411 / MH2) TaxID=760142 RepID=F2LVB5_HIPMA|nr:flagellar hook-basal body protein [Hippea maritima]AEA33699.1 flagellar hook-basal body protein [Hippea maritima DSM 10411]